MHRTVVFTTLVLVVVALVGCGSGGIPENAALKVTGLVDTEVGWAEEQGPAFRGMCNNHRCTRIDTDVNRRDSAPRVAPRCLSLLAAGNRCVA